MIIYISKAKIDNLYTEASLMKKIGIFSRLNLKISFKTNTKIGEIACESGTLEQEDYLAKYDMILKYLKKKKMLHYLNWDTHVERFHYYKCKGSIISNLNAMHPDSIAEYKMKVENQNYDDILFHCSSVNLFTLSNMNALDGGIASFRKGFENRDILVNAIFIVKYVENRTIIATPLILFS